jgi:Ca2+/Na+ antiporter
MKLPRLEEMNSERFLHEAFDKGMRVQWQKIILIRRNVYLWLFIIAMLCVLYTAIVNRMTLCILSLFLATISLVVMTKYDTQLRFLKILKLRDEQKNNEPNHA